MYKQAPSEFEVQSLAFGILRKNLYPEYLVRGEYKFPKMRADIAIFKATNSEPELKLIIEVKKSETGTSESQKERYEFLLDTPCVYIRGYNDAYKVMELIKDHL